MEFIPARESALFIFLFRWYTWFLFKRRFRHVWIRQDYHPDKTDRTVYYMNHRSWWDGLIPFLLNEFRFKQRARALMEDKQIEKYSFFRKIGAFSINRDDPRKAITSLRYAVQSMKREHASLYIYPEGTIRPEGSHIRFEGGLAWLNSKLEDVDFVPVAAKIHTIRTDKPELHLAVGQPAEIAPDISNKEATAVFERALQSLVDELNQEAGFDDSGFEQII